MRVRKCMQFSGSVVIVSKWPRKVEKARSRRTRTQQEQDLQSAQLAQEVQEQSPMLAVWIEESEKTGEKC